jgi:hypothetical protein
MDQNKILHDRRHLGVPSGASKMISEPVVCSAQSVHLSCIKISTLQIEWSEHPLEPHHLGVLSGASKRIYEPMVHLAQTVHLSYTDTNDVSKQIETRFHMTDVTKEFHPARPKWCQNLWYVRCKTCTYLALRFALSPNRTKWASTRALSSRSTIECVQKDFWANGTFGTNHAPILHWQ